MPQHTLPHEDISTFLESKKDLDSRKVKIFLLPLFLFCKIKQRRFQLPLIHG